MTTMLIYIIIILALAVVLLLASRRTRERAVGICRSAIERVTRKERKKEKILEYLKEKGEGVNEEIRTHLGVSRRSVARYMDELEREGRVVQEGDIGRGVTYRLR